MLADHSIHPLAVINSLYSRNHNKNLQEWDNRTWQVKCLCCFLLLSWAIPVVHATTGYAVASSLCDPGPLDRYRLTPSGCLGGASRFKPRSSLSADEMALCTNSLFGALRYSVRLNHFYLRGAPPLADHRSGKGWCWPRTAYVSLSVLK